MTTYVDPKVNTEFVIYICLNSQANPNVFQANPTIAAGDFKIATDDAAPANLATLPTVDADFTKRVKVTISASEMNGANATLIWSDVAGAEWCDGYRNLQTVARQIDDLAYPATPGRSMVVDANGLVDANVVKVGPTGSGTAQTARDLGGTLGAAGAGLTDLGGMSTTMKAQVNTEVLDVLNVDTFAEPTGAPAATTTLAGKIGRIYQVLRNKMTVTSSAKTFFDDSAASLWSKSLTDDGSTYTENEGS